MIVLDTSALLYWTFYPNRLTPKASQAIKQADRILISSLTIWEIALKEKRHKLSLPMSIPDFINGLEQLESLEILSVDVQTWLDNVELPWENRDPADRTIVALATRFKCPLITSDVKIAYYYPETIW
jgi:PIN domain nuclease of toxin-antitoxin system